MQPVIPEHGVLLDHRRDRLAIRQRPFLLVQWPADLAVVRRVPERAGDGASEVRRLATRLQRRQRRGERLRPTQRRKRELVPVEQVGGFLVRQLEQQVLRFLTVRDQR